MAVVPGRLNLAARGAAVPQPACDKPPQELLLTRWCACGHVATPRCDHVVTLVRTSFFKNTLFSVFETRGDHMVIFDGHMVTPQGGHMAPSRCDHVVARRVAGGDHQPRCLGGSARAAWASLTLAA